MSEENPESQINPIPDAAVAVTATAVAVSNSSDEVVMPEIVVSLDDNVPSMSTTTTSRRPLQSGKCSGNADPSLCNVRRLKHELDEIRAHPPPYCCVAIKAEDLYHWTAIVNGPAGTVYEGGHFRLDLHFPTSYPFKPPIVRFLTRIYHCNVDRCGTICLDVLADRWSPIITVSKVLLSIYLLMGDCNPNDPLDSYIADMYMNNRTEHDRIARYWTKRFAKPEGE